MDLRADVYPSNIINKKYMIVITHGDRRKTLQIGDNRYEDYTQHKDDKPNKN